MGQPTHARAVIVGGGIIGCSTAYHLAGLGWQEIVILERAQLTSGSTFHAAGLVGQLRSSASITQLLKYSVELYGRLEAETGQATGELGIKVIGVSETTSAPWTGTMDGDTLTLSVSAEDTFAGGVVGFEGVITATRGS